VYNASAGLPAPAADLTPAQVLADLQVNVAAALAGARWALPAMRAARRGTLLFTGGGLGLKPQAGLASGSLGKAALRSLALSFAEELEPEGIHAATVTIRGFVQTGTGLSPERIAARFWDLHAQPPGAWDRELVLP
jgi:NAD(P)-dependent dehydrogenase (short-subunit alcohol dehydrogenase family)